MTKLSIPATPPGTPRREDRRVPSAALGIAVAVVEALSGRRPLHQIRTRMTRAAFESLVALLGTSRFTAVGQGRITAQMPSAEAVEATASINVAGRWLACVVRLDLGPYGWACSEFAVVGVPA